MHVQRHEEDWREDTISLTKKYASIIIQVYRITKMLGDRNVIVAFV